MDFEKKSNQDDSNGEMFVVFFWAKFQKIDQFFIHKFIQIKSVPIELIICVLENSNNLFNTVLNGFFQKLHVLDAYPISLHETVGTQKHLVIYLVSINVLDCSFLNNETKYSFGQYVK